MIMRKSKLAWVVTATVLAALLMSTGCRGTWRPWWRKEAPPPPISIPAADRPTVVTPREPIRTREVTTPVAEVEVRGTMFEPADLQVVHFEFDKSQITEEARVVLEGNAEIIKQNPGAIIQIEGHCDERGTNDYNLALGQRRAKATRDYLINLGVDPSVLVTISYGEEQPVDPRHNEEAWAKNRRAQFNKAQ
jgi:peptidoglycan-associated lipoprotein